jgi:hypothetical protein
MMMAAAYGMIVWPLIAMIALSRQEFAVAIESYLRAIPPPFGDTIADLFMEANKLGAKLDEKRRKVANDLTTALGTIANVVQETYDRVQQGINNARQLKDDAPIAQNIQTLSNNITSAAKKPTPVTGQGRKRLSTKRRKKNKWTRTRRIRFATR